MFRLRHHIRSIQARKLSLIWRLLAHFPEEPALRIGIVCGNVQRPLRRIKTCNDVQAGFVHCTLRFLRVFESYADLVGDGYLDNQDTLYAHLISQLWTFIHFKVSVRLSKVILYEVKEHIVILLRDARIV